MMTYDQWLESTLCPADCFGCAYNVFTKDRAACSYKGGKCYYYTQYCKEAKAKAKADDHPTLFD